MERSNYTRLSDRCVTSDRFNTCQHYNNIADASAINALCIRRVTATTRAYNETRGDTSVISNGEQRMQAQCL